MLRGCAEGPPPPSQGLKVLFKDKELQSLMFQSHFPVSCFRERVCFPPLSLPWAVVAFSSRNFRAREQPTESHMEP